HATLLLEKGAKMKEISERLGNSRISITMDTYSHVTDKMRNETVDIMENIRKNS
ncbi:site-specific integrase, partial [Staphylococcus pseudintermedius]